MRIAVACTADFSTIAGHVGRARRWLVFDTESGGPPERIELAGEDVFHHFEGKSPHPLLNVEAIITLSAGDGFLAKMKKMGIATMLTAERDPAKAVSDYLADRLSPPTPRPIGSLVCKAIDLLSKHK